MHHKADLGKFSCSHEMDSRIKPICQFRLQQELQILDLISTRPTHDLLDNKKLGLTGDWFA